MLRSHITYYNGKNHTVIVLRKNYTRGKGMSKRLVHQTG